MPRHREYARVPATVKSALGPTLAAIAALWGCILPSLALGQPPKDGGAAVASPKHGDGPPDWQFESLKLKDGTVYTGLIQAERETEIEFAEIARPPGKAMFAVVRPVAPESIAETIRLEGDARTELLNRFRQLRNRARIEAGRIEDVTLREDVREGVLHWTADRFWFRLDSTAEASMTRRCVVRVEQMFRAYRQLLPPRTEQAGGLRLLLFGSLDEYRRFMRESGFRIPNPAFYSSAHNMIVAGSDLNSYAGRLAQVQARNREVRRQYRMLDAGFPDRLSGVLVEMRRRGYSEPEIEQEAKLRKAVWQRQYDAAMKEIDLAERQNEAKFAEVTEQMLTRLYHEAFHAYVENYVYPQRNGAMPRWLNEGLAQIFESGQLDADTLRIDAPDRERLGRLQADLTGGDSLAVADLLTAEENEFLAAHESDTAERHYLYCWGLAYYMAFENSMLAGEAMDQYVANKENYGPTARFIRLVNMPLQKFDEQWQAAILRLRPS